MRRRQLGSVALGLVVIVGLAAGFGPAAALVVGFAVFVPLERVWRRHDQPVRRPGLRTDVMHLLFSGLLQNAALLVGAGLVVLALRSFTWSASADWLVARPLGVQAIAGFAVFEVGSYWYHRLSHQVGFLWRFHSVHHSSEHLDWIAAARLHPLEGFFAGLVIAPAFVMLGFRPASLGAFSALATAWAVMLHANVRWRMAALDGIVGTPEYHHWHHSNHPQARGKNYSGLMPVLDRIFGTYYLPSHRRPEVYGIDEAMPTGWWGQLRQPLRRRRPTALQPF